MLKYVGLATLTLAILGILGKAADWYIGLKIEYAVGPVRKTANQNGEDIKAVKAENKEQDKKLMRIKGALLDQVINGLPEKEKERILNIDRLFATKSSDPVFDYLKKRGIIVPTSPDQPPQLSLFGKEVNKLLQQRGGLLRKPSRRP